MTVNNYDKRKLILLRFALIVIGAGLGFLALWQYFLYFPDIVRREYQIVITVVSSALIALLLGLSAKPFYRLIASIMFGIRSAGSKIGKRGIAALAVGFVVAGAVVVAFDMGIRLVLDIWAVRLLTDVLAYILSAALCCYGFTKLFTMQRTERPAPPTVGYLICAECLFDERAVTAAYALMNVKVCDAAYKALCLIGGDSAAAVQRLDALTASGAVGVVHCDKEFATAAEYAEAEAELAAAKRLRIVGVATELSLDMFATPTEKVISECIKKDPVELGGE